MGRSEVEQKILLFAFASKWVGRARKTFDQLGVALYRWIDPSRVPKFLENPDDITAQWGRLPILERKIQELLPNNNHVVHFFHQNRQWKFIRIVIACFGKN